MLDRYLDGRQDRIKCEPGKVECKTCEDSKHVDKPELTIVVSEKKEETVELDEFGELDGNINII